MKGRRLQPVIVALLAAPPALILLLLVPIWGRIPGGAISLLKRITSEGDWSTAVLHSVVFAVSTTGVAVAVGYVLAARLGARLAERRPTLLTLLLVPALVGDAPLAFALKLGLLDGSLQPDWIGRGAWAWSLLGLAQLWQLVPLGTYFFVRSLAAQADAPAWRYARFHHFNRSELARHVLVPQFRPLVLVLAVLFSVRGFHEVAKGALLFRSSAGTGLEFLGHRLAREYHLLAPLDGAHAIEETLVVAAGCALAALMTAAVSVAFGQLLLRASAAVVRVETSANSRLLVVMLVTMLMPMTPALVRAFEGGRIELGVLMSGLGFASFAAAIAGVLSVGFAFAFRCVATQHSYAFTSRMVAFFLLCLSFYMVPAIAIAFASFEWASWLGLADAPSAAAVWAWLAAESLYALPLLVAFCAYLNFAVPTRELQWLRNKGATYREVGRLSFWARLWPGYLLAFLFGVLLVLLEVPMTVILGGFSRAIDSVGSYLAVKVSGRASSYDEAAAMVALTTLVATVLVVLWSQLERQLVSKK